MNKPQLCLAPQKKWGAETGLTLEDIVVMTVSICAALGAFWYLWKRFVK